MHKPYILVAGNIGAGKTAVVESLSEELGLAALSSDHQENPFLDRFYADRGRWAFPSQAFFLQQGLVQHRHIREQGGVQDQSVHEHFLVFAHQLRDEGVLLPEEFDVLSGMYYGMQPSLAAPSLLVFLDAAPDVLLERAKAQQGHEQHIDLDYLEALGSRYQSFADSWIHSPVLQVDAAQDSEDILGSILSCLD